MIDLLKLEPVEAERIAYAEGFTGTADLFARIAALEADLRRVRDENEILKDELYAARHERAYLGDSE